jgi:hypothetical protein
MVRLHGAGQGPSIHPEQVRGRWNATEAVYGLSGFGGEQDRETFHLLPAPPIALLHVHASSFPAAE